MAEEKHEFSLDFKLQLAMLENHEDQADALLSQGANIHTLEDDTFRTLLHEAAYYGNVHNIIWLIGEHGFDVMALDYYNNTPAHLAAMAGQLDAIFELANRGANMDARNGNDFTVREVLVDNQPDLATQWDEHFGTHSLTAVVTATTEIGLDLHHITGDHDTHHMGDFSDHSDTGGHDSGTT